MNSIDLDGTRINPFQKKEIDGVTVKVCLSPYEVPQYLLSNFNKDSGNLELSFSYLYNDKDMDDFKTSGPVTIFYGHKNKLVQKIVIHLGDQIDEDLKFNVEVSLVSAAIDQFKRDVVPGMRFKPGSEIEIEKDHLEVVKRAVSLNIDQLVYNRSL